MVVEDEQGHVVAEIAQPIGVATNNVAEYQAFLKAVEEAQRKGADSVDIRSDSQLLVRQLTGKYKIKDPHLQRLAGRAIRGLSMFERWTLQHIPRELNRKADRLANSALRAARPALKNRKI